MSDRCLLTPPSARYAEYFDAIIEKDNFTPLLVSSVDEEFEIYSVFPFDRDVIGASFGVLESPGYSGNVFPKKLPFSRMVLRIFGQLKKFIDEYLEYCAGVEMNSVQIDEASRKALVSLVRRPLRDSLKKLTVQDNVGLHQLMQVRKLIIFYKEHICEKSTILSFKNDFIEGLN